MKEFLERIEKNPELKAKVDELNQNPEAAPADLIALAKEYGVELTEADFAPPQGELSEDELDAVAGGGQCVCPLAGGGTPGNGHPACGCVLVGMGEMYTVGSGRQRCICSMGGNGSADKEFKL